MNDLEKARNLVSKLQRELTRRRDKKLRELFCEEAVALINRTALHLKYADEKGENVLFERAGQGLVYLFSKLNTTKQGEEVREIKASLINLVEIISQLNDVAQSGLFRTTDVAYETSKVKRFLQKLVQGVETYTTASCD